MVKIMIIIMIMIVIIVMIMIMIMIIIKIMIMTAIHDDHDRDLMFQCQDYEKYLAEIGTGPLSRVMVMRASVVVNIMQVLETLNGNSLFFLLHILLNCLIISFS